MEPYQQFRLGSRIELLAVRRDAKRDYHYNRLSDIQHYFPSAWGFKVNGINILFLEDENEESFEPKRIAHYPDTIIDIVTLNQDESPPSLTPDGTDVEDTASLDKHELSSATEDVDQSVPTLSVQPNSATTTRPRRATFGADSAPVQLSSTLVTRSQPIDSTGLHDHQHHHHQQQLALILGDDQSPPTPHNTAAAQTEEHSLVSAPNQNKVHKELADPQLAVEQSHDVGDKHHAIDPQEQEQQQQQTLDQLVLAQKTLDATFTLNEELHDYPIPRLFVLLPASFSSRNPNGAPLQKSRLYFLCECGGRCDNNDSGQDVSPSNQTATKTTELPETRTRTMVHLVKHDGYEVSRTAEFIEKYGSNVLGMLAVLKHCLALTALTNPTLGVFHEQVDPSSRTAEDAVRNTITAINLTIDSLEKTLGLDSDQDEADNTNLDADGASETFRNLRTLDGAEHRRLDTFLRSHDNDGFLGGLYRVTTESGLIKWVCFEHYRRHYAASSMDSFIDMVEAIGGAYSPYLSKAVVNLTSSSSAKNFFTKLTSQALVLDELDVALHWKFGSSDLTALAAAVAQSNLRILRLDMRDDKGKKSAFEGMSLGKGRYHPLLQLVSSRKLRGVFFSNVHHLGSRVSGYPPNQMTSTLERFHLLNVIEPADQVRLANILTSCPNLKDLRLGSFSTQRRMHPTLHLAIASLKMLRSLHIYSMDTGLPDLSLNGESAKWEDVPLSTDVLKGLVSTGCSMDRAKLENLIQASSGILEVLILEFTEKQREIVELAPAPYRELANSSHRQSLTALCPTARPFSKLTHLHLGTGITESSIDLLASVVWNLSLVHFGTDEYSKRLLKYVNFASLKSISLTDLTEEDLQPLFDAFLEENRPCQLERMDLKVAGDIQTLLDLLQAIPLKRLELMDFRRVELAKIMPVINLSRLEVLSIQQRTVVNGNWANGYCRDLLTSRLEQESIVSNLVVQIECENTRLEEVSGHKTGDVMGSAFTKFPYLKRTEMDSQHWHSILSTVY
ncbi:hypothetical protein BGX23_008602 [Mortierella sp. AD031]|nr:hypothetical protein BGX23_008602 [Mortierella sp. AD031]